MQKEDGPQNRLPLQPNLHQNLRKFASTIQGSAHKLPDIAQLGAYLTC